MVERASHYHSLFRYDNSQVYYCWEKLVDELTMHARRVQEGTLRKNIL